MKFIPSPFIRMEREGPRRSVNVGVVGEATRTYKLNVIIVAMVLQELASVIENKEISPGYFHLRVSSPRIAAQCKPGQFAEIRVSDTLDPLLRRPLSFYIYGNGNVEFVYRVVGYGTDILSKKSAGDTLDMLGPLGNGFDLSAAAKASEILVVGGGMGMVPLYPLIDILCHSKDLPPYEVLYGARNKKDMVVFDALQNECISCCAITEDGSCGEKGLLTDLLLKRLRDRKNLYVISCGPHGMLKAIAAMVKQYKVPAQMSLEEKMACGVGACLGCVMETTEGYKKVCKDGPVFMADEIKW